MQDHQRIVGADYISVSIGVPSSDVGLGFSTQILLPKGSGMQFPKLLPRIVIEFICWVAKGEFPRQDSPRLLGEDVFSTFMPADLR